MRSLNPGSELWASADGSQRFLEFYAPRKLGTSIAREMAQPFVAVFKGATYLVTFALIAAIEHPPGTQ